MTILKRDSLLLRTFNLLPKMEKRKLYLSITMYCAVNLLDLLGIFGIGVATFFNLKNYNEIDTEKYAWIPFSKQIWAIPYNKLIFLIFLFIVFVFVLKTLLSLFFTKKIFIFLGNFCAELSVKLIKQIILQPLLFIHSRSQQAFLYMVTRGVETLVLQVIANSAILVSDAFLFLLLGVSLLYINPGVAIVSLIFFVAIGLILFFYQNGNLKNLGTKNFSINVLSNEKIIEVFSNYRELTLRDRKESYVRKIGLLRQQLARIIAELSFAPFVSKYILELSVVIGAVIIGITTFYSEGTTKALVSLAIFLTAGMRLAPALLRIQQALIQIRSGISTGKETLELIEELELVFAATDNQKEIDTIYTFMKPELKLESVNFTYPGNSRPTIKNVNVEISAGSSIAVVGRSGAGKSTLVDLILGLISPDSGSIKISGIEPQLIWKKWPGKISYVPQDIFLITGTIRENILLGFSNDEISEADLQEVIKKSHLDDFLKELSLGIDTLIGEKGLNLSGGQRQRIGIARALISKPTLLVLDEATSSLDGETESVIIETLKELKGSITVITIAHRLSTVRDADSIIYLENGKIEATGSFEALRVRVPNFDKNVKLMGL